MNTPFPQPVQEEFDYPELIEATFDFDVSTAAKYAYHGDYLFIGTLTGHTLIMNSISRCVITRLASIQGPISTISPSTCGRYVLVGATNGVIARFDLSGRTSLTTMQDTIPCDIAPDYVISIPVPVRHVALSPSDPDLIFVAPSRGHAFLSYLPQDTSADSFSLSQAPAQAAPPSTPAVAESGSMSDTAQPSGSAPTTRSYRAHSLAELEAQLQQPGRCLLRVPDVSVSTAPSRFPATARSLATCTASCSDRSLSTPVSSGSLCASSAASAPAYDPHAPDGPPVQGTPARHRAAAIPVSAAVCALLDSGALVSATEAELRALLHVPAHERDWMRHAPLELLMAWADTHAAALEAARSRQWGLFGLWEDLELVLCGNAALVTEHSSVAGKAGGVTLAPPVSALAPSDTPAASVVGPVQAYGVRMEAVAQRPCTRHSAEGHAPTSAAARAGPPPAHALLRTLDLAAVAQAADPVEVELVRRHVSLEELYAWAAARRDMQYDATVADLTDSSGSVDTAASLPALQWSSALSRSVLPVADTALGLAFPQPALPFAYPGKTALSVDGSPRLFLTAAEEEHYLTEMALVALAVQRLRLAASRREDEVSNGALASLPTQQALLTAVLPVPPATPEHADAARYLGPSSGAGAIGATADGAPTLTTMTAMTAAAETDDAMESADEDAPVRARAEAVARAIAPPHTLYADPSRPLVLPVRPVPNPFDAPTTFAGATVVPPTAARSVPAIDGDPTASLASLFVPLETPGTYMGPRGALCTRAGFPEVLVPAISDGALVLVRPDPSPLREPIDGATTPFGVSTVEHQYSSEGGVRGADDATDVHDMEAWLRAQPELACCGAFLCARQQHEPGGAARSTSSPAAAVESIWAVLARVEDGPIAEAQAAIARDERDNFLVSADGGGRDSEAANETAPWSWSDLPPRSTGELLVGTSCGALWVFDLAGQPLRQVKRAGGGVVRALVASTDGAAVLGVWAGKAMRVLDGQSLRVRSIVRQAATRTGWRTAMLSPRHTYIIALSLAASAHLVEVWDTRTANIVKVFQGPREGAYDVAQHPSLPLVASVTAAGSLMVLSRPSAERWSAFVPDFEEMSNNQEYREREDEFDAVYVRTSAADMVKHDMLETTAQPIVLHRPSRGTRRARNYTSPAPPFVPLIAAGESETATAAFTVHTAASRTRRDWWEEANAAAMVEGSAATTTAAGEERTGILQLPTLQVQVLPDPLLVAMHIRSMGAWYRAREEARLSGKATAPSAVGARNARGVRWNRVDAASTSVITSVLSDADLDPTLATQALVDMEASQESLRGMDVLAARDATARAAAPHRIVPTPLVAGHPPSRPLGHALASSRSRAAAAQAHLDPQQRELIAEVLRAGSHTQKLTLAHVYALHDALKHGSVSLAELDPAAALWLEGLRSVRDAPVPIWARAHGGSATDLNAVELVRAMERAGEEMREVDEAAVHIALQLGQPGAVKRLRGFDPDTQYDEGAAACRVDIAALESQLCSADAGAKTDLLAHLESQMLRKVEE